MRRQGNIVKVSHDLEVTLQHWLTVAFSAEVRFLSRILLYRELLILWTTRQRHYEILELTD
ncbi:hypothetical protein D915_011181 [Fasciola hepatica]|uniref:Uncharacterized protein n=1 Tax=Fasciola hepatica TaxID=6192 RepID=A0A4E0R848_FASHE|nr:hypothetical protein D915_011181 [Fasciola hepatica]